jgi:hypothetical protein
MKKSILLSLLAISAFTFSCKKDDPVVNADKIYQVSTTLSGANEIPAVTTSATGSTTGTYNQTTKILTVSTTLSGITPTMGHIHTQTVPTLPDKSGPVTFPFSTLTSPVVFTTTTPLTAAQEADLLNGIMYVNFHTTANPKGEIRGNLSVK